ncbi:hypothetical protein J437_LFUL006417 [Ladona fulva]|uniref:dolichol kinase n=1 Tax=Ladona fulva TaxID=123851 RepID=A0A8K0K4H3_LADFU|nr:hypothetical protein J437_LFUL006417 [Ladona fulva]
MSRQEYFLKRSCDYFEKLSACTNVSLNVYALYYRPGASCGFWLAILLPIAVYSAEDNLLEPNDIYFRLSTVTCTTLFAAAILYIRYLYRTAETINDLSWFHYIPIAVASFLLYLYFRLYIFAFIFIGTINAYLYIVGLSFVFGKFPLSFTYGEASIAVQAAIMFAIRSIRNIFLMHKQPNLTDIQKITLVLQVGLVGCGLIVFLVYNFPVTKRLTGLLISLFVVPFGFIVPLLRRLLGEDPILWLLWLIFSDVNRVMLLVYWFGCCVLAILAVGSQMTKSTVASTVVRKNFHYLIVAVYIPGVIFDCSLLYLSSGIALAIFILVEMVRVLQIQPFGDILQKSFESFADEKDQGVLALTPIYLLAGCSLPLWIKPDYCSAGPERYLPALAGILSVGIGDTAASVGGSLYGKHKWSGIIKLMESLKWIHKITRGNSIFNFMPISCNNSLNNIW